VLSEKLPYDHGDTVKQRFQPMYETALEQKYGGSRKFTGTFKERF
jgi:hypothetical protein